MAISVRQVDLRQDRDKLVTFLHQNLTVRSNASRFNWLYLENPSGLARGWMALNEASEIVGVGAAFPRLVWIDRKPRRGWVLGDLCIAPESRSLGPALLLQRICLKSLEIEGNPAWFDFPSGPMMAIYRRLGILAAANHVRYVKIFRVDKIVERFIPATSVARGISRIGNLALKSQRAMYRPPRGVEVSEHEGMFREEFSALDRATANLHTIRGLRTAEYLNWRYLRNPFNQYRVIAARRGGRLLGYAVLEMTGRHWILTDIDAIEEASTIPSLLAYLDQVAETSNIDSISTPIMERAPLIQYLRRAGFYPREVTPIVARVGGLQTPPSAPNGQNWFLMHGDRES
jgi:hypothetical protein